jgi:molybdenum cofactor biosynthesis enzyme MoaA
MKLEDIGFYTLSDYRAKNVSDKSPMWRCEMILTGRCNFKCPYCRGLSVISEKCFEDMDVRVARQVLDTWIDGGLKNVRFSGGEPTLYPFLNDLVEHCSNNGVEKIAISTNGSRNFSIYEELIKRGINDFSISLDACCASFGDKMAGVPGKWDTVVDNIKRLSKLTYVTVGVVLTEDNIEDTKKIIEFANTLGVADIRIISAAQYNKLIDGLSNIDRSILDSHPILKYRVEHLDIGRNVRGIKENDCHHCYLVKDDSVVAGQWHFPCVIHMREGGKAIGKVSPNMRQERIEWFNKHNSYQDDICRNNCLDVCIDYNNKCDEYQKNQK